MDKHLVLLVTVTSKGCFTDEGSNDDVVCALVAETRDRIMGGVNIMILPYLHLKNWVPFILYRGLGAY